MSKKILREEAQQTNKFIPEEDKIIKTESRWELT